jgi:hypothetical protein
MNNPNNGREKELERKSASNSFGDLIRHAFSKSPDAKEAYQKLRTTYEKDEYRGVFPPSMIYVERRIVGPVRSRERDFRYSINRESICFIRNLWFLHQFLPRPGDVVRFLTTMKPDERRKKFELRFKELEALAGTYAKWSKAAGGISQKLENFKPTKTDLLAASECVAGTPETTISSPTPSGSAAVADMIREVEQRASYQAGNPDDACEKALYFLALGRPDIGEIIAREVLAENPDHAVALFANALFLLNASERHERQAFIHDTMHPHDLEAIESEEFYHVDRHAEETLQAWEKESQAFLLMLKARQNWPKRFSIKCYELSPDMWQHKVEEWILRQAVVRLTEESSRLSLPKSEDAEVALKMLRWVIADIQKARGGAFFRPFWSGGLGRFIIVAAHVHVDVARACLKELEAALEHSKPRESDLIWRDFDMELPISQEPTFAETLIPAVKNARFCQAVFSMRTTTEASTLLRRITQTGLSEEHDRRTAMRSLTMRGVVLNFAHRKCFAQAIELCREMAERRDWPATETGRKLRACWRYGSVALLFEFSRAAFEANKIPTAAKQVGLALRLATDSLAAIEGEKPLLKFIERDEDGMLEIIGDFLRGQPNIVTDTSPSDFFPQPTPGIWVRVPHNSCWDEFVNWSEREAFGHKSALLAYGIWLAQQHGQSELLLPKCKAFAAKLDSLKSK